MDILLIRKSRSVTRRGSKGFKELLSPLRRSGLARLGLASVFRHAAIADRHRAVAAEQRVLLAAGRSSTVGTRQSHSSAHDGVLADSLSRKDHGSNTLQLPSWHGLYNASNHVLT